VEERLADAVENQRFNIRQRLGQAGEGRVGKVSLGHAAIGGLLDAHEAVEVAAAGGLDEELGRVGHEGGMRP
jgi:hypothetical protein